jgi:hypothetical protein
MINLKSFLDKKVLFIAILFSIPAVMALLVKGYYGASDDLHIAWLYEMHQTLRTGQFPPRFVPDLSYGFGYPLFNFVFPLPFYIGEIFHLLSLNFVDSVKLVFLISVPLSFITMYKLMRRFTTQELSLAASILYVFTPYRATDIYVRGALGESFSFVFLPIILLSIYEITRSLNKIYKFNYKWIGIGGVSLMCLVLTHNIVSYMFLPFALCFLLIRLYVNKFSKYYFIQSLTMITLGVFGSAYFWFPAIIDSSLMRYDMVFNYWDHFPTLRQLITPFFGYGASVPGPYDGMSFYIGFVNLIVFLLATAYLLVNFKKIPTKSITLYFWALATLLFSVFLMNYRSSLIWKYVPFLAYFQFPWRFITMITLVSPLFLVVFSNFRFKKYLAIFIGVVSIAVNFQYFKPHDFLGRVDSYYINRYIPFPKVSQEYMMTGEEYLRLGIKTKSRPEKIYPVFFGTNSLRFNLLETDRISSSANISSTESGIVSYNKYNFPGWKVFIDGKEVDSFYGEPFGQVSFNFPGGNHKVEVTYKEIQRNIVLDGISFLSLIALIVFIFKDRLSLISKKKY